MKELLEYREKLIRRFGEAAQEFRVACEAVNNPFEKIEDGWTLHQIVSHVRDTEKVVYSERIYQTLNGDNPEFKDCMLEVVNQRANEAQSIDRGRSSAGISHFLFTMILPG